MEREQKPEYLLADDVKLEPSVDVKEEVKNPLTPPDDALGALYSKCLQSRVHNTVTAEARQQNRKCSICMDRFPQNLMKNVSMDEEQIVIAAILYDKFASVEAVNQFVRYKNLFVCHSHFIETNKRIEEYLSNYSNIKALLPIFRFLDPQYQFTTETIAAMMKRFSNSNKFRAPVKRLYPLVDPPLLSVDSPEPKRPVNYPPMLQVKTSKMTFVWCCICMQSVARELSKQVTIDEEKIIFASTFRPKFPAASDVCQFFKRPKSYVCHSDILKTYAKINEYRLNGSVIDAVLMPTVRIAYPFVTRKLFEKMMSDFLRRNVDIGRKHSPPPPKTKIAKETPYSSSGCLICHSTGSNVVTKSENMKVLLMVGCVRRCTHTIQQAEHLVGPEKFECCQRHYGETIDTIFYDLGIRSSAELGSCSPDSMRNFMELVHIFSPRTTFRDLHNAIYELVRKFDFFKRQDDCASSEIQPEEKEIKVEPIDEIEEEEIFDDEYFERNPPKLEPFDD